MRDFAPVVFAGNTANLLVANPGVPVKTVKELLALARAKPAQLTYASTGAGSSNHMSMELFKMMTKTDIVHIPYKGAAPATVDLLAGHVQFRFSSVVPAVPHVRSGRLRGLGITSARRYTPMPDVPTIAESGLPGYAVEAFYVVMAPSATPRAIVEKLHDEIAKRLKDPEVHTRMANDGAEVIAASLADTAKMLRDDYQRWAKPVKDSGARAD